MWRHRVRSSDYKFLLQVDATPLSFLCQHRQAITYNLKNVPVPPVPVLSPSNGCLAGEVNMR